MINNPAELLRRAGAELIEINQGSYMEYSIRRPGKRDRVIQEPCPELKAIQKALLPAVNEFRLLNCATAKKGSNILRNAMPHMLSKYVLQVDIKSCFPSTGIYPTIRAVESSNRWGLVPLNYLEFITTYIGYFFLPNGLLPTGAPTSPMMANIALTPIDRQLRKLAKEGYIYTRYMDDITISTRNDSRDWGIIDKVKDILAEHGYESNTRKSRWQTVGKSDNIIVTGVQLTGERRVPKKIRRKVRAMIHKSKGVMSSELQGYLAFIKSLDTKLYNDMMLRLEKAPR
jgi:hypothetical protein